MLLFYYYETNWLQIYMQLIGFANFYSDLK